MTSLNLTLGDTRLIINTCKRHNLLRNQCAYALATAYHETAHTMKPVREMGGEAYLRKKKYYPYVGMGYVQLTWKTNYQKASDKLGVDFVANPKLLLKPEFASEILVVGSRDGWFTTRKLSDYITLYKSDFVGARRIINGTDKADLIANYAKKYDALLKAEGYGEGKPPVETYTPWTPSKVPLPPVTVPDSQIPSSDEARKKLEEIVARNPDDFEPYPDPSVVHVEPDGTVKPGPSDKPRHVEKNIWRVIWNAILAYVFRVKK